MHRHHNQIELYIYLSLYRMNDLPGNAADPDTNNRKRRHASRYAACCSLDDSLYSFINRAYIVGTAINKFNGPPYDALRSAGDAKKSHACLALNLG